MIPAAIPLQAQYILDFQRALSAAGDNAPSMLDETQVYIGLNDADTKEQLYETKAYVSLLRELCHSYKVPFSFDVIEGGYIHDDGEYTEEKSIVLTFIDVPQDTIDAIAKELCRLFHQESVLMTSERLLVRSVRVAP